MSMKSKLVEPPMEQTQTTDDLICEECDNPIYGVMPIQVEPDKYICQRCFRAKRFRIAVDERKQRSWPFG